MNKLIAFASTFLFALVAHAKPVVQIQHWQLSNGAKVYFVAAPELPMVDVNVLFAAGSAYDNTQWGISSFTNEMLSEGTKTKNADQVAEAFDKVGAQYSSEVNQDYAKVSLRSLSQERYLQPALSIFAEVINQANFPEDAFQRNRNNVKVEIRDQLQQPAQIAENKLLSLIYASQPYAHPPIGTANSVEQFTRDQVAQFYQQYYVAKNAKVIIVGNLSRPQAEQIAQNLVGHLPAGMAAPKLAMALDTSIAKVEHVKYPAQQTTIMLGQTGITRAYPNYFPLIVGNYVLGGSPLNSIFFREVRDQRGLAYHAESAFDALQYRGPFMIMLQTKASSAQQALALVRQLLQNYIVQGPTQSQLELAQQNLVNSFPLTLATNRSLLQTVSMIAFYELPLDYLDHYQTRVKAVTSAQIKSAFQQTVNPNKMVTVTVGP